MEYDPMIGTWLGVSQNRNRAGGPRLNSYRSTKLEEQHGGGIGSPDHVF